MYTVYFLQTKDNISTYCDNFNCSSLYIVIVVFLDTDSIDLVDYLTV